MKRAFCLKGLFGTQKKCFWTVGFLYALLFSFQRGIPKNSVFEISCSSETEFSNKIVTGPICLSYSMLFFLKEQQMVAIF